VFISALVPRTPHPRPEAGQDETGLALAGRCGLGSSLLHTVSNGGCAGDAAPRDRRAFPEKPAHEHFPHGIGRLEQRTSAAKAQAGRRGTSSRRTFVTAFCAAVALGGNSHVAVAKDVINDCEKWAPGRKWLSGKSCQEKVSFVFGQLASKPCKQRAFTGINVLVARPSCERG
jgi:hypothetical protein